jgi:hypothetical protein
MHTMRTYVAGILLVLGLVGLLAGVLTAPLQAQEQNLLVNSGFEASYKNGVANGWSSWYENSGDLCNTKPMGGTLSANRTGLRRATTAISD